MVFKQKSRWSKVVLLFLCLSVVEKGWVRQTHPFELGAVVITTYEMLSALTLAGSMIWHACTNSKNSAVDRVLQSEISKLTKRHDMPSAHPTVSVQQAKPVPVTKPVTTIEQVSSPSVQKTSNVIKARAVVPQVPHEHVVQAVYTALPEATKVASQELLSQVAIDWQKQIERSCCESIRSARAQAYNQMQVHIQNWHQKWTCENNDKGGITYRAPNPQAYASINSKNRRIVGSPAETPEHFERMIIDLNPEFSMPVQTVIQAFVDNAQSLVYGTLPERVAALLNLGEFAIDGITYGQELCDAKSALYAAYCHQDGSICMQALHDMSAAQKIMHEYYGFKRAHTALFRKPCITSSHKPCKQLIKKKRKVSFEVIHNQHANHCCQRILHAFAVGEIQQAQQIKNSHAHLHNLAVLYNALKVEYDRAIAEQEALLKDAYGIVHFRLPVELQDPVYTTLSAQERARLQNSPSALASFNDMLKLRQLYKQALHTAWNIPASVDPVVHQALYALIDCGAIPERIDKMCELVNNTKNIHEQQELMRALFLPNGIIKDFAEYDRAKSLTIPATILKEECAKIRQLLNHLVYAERICEDEYIQDKCAAAIECIQYVVAIEDEEDPELYLSYAGDVYQQIIAANMLFNEQQPTDNQQNNNQLPPDPSKQPNKNKKNQKPPENKNGPRLQQMTKDQWKKSVDYCSQDNNLRHWFRKNLIRHKFVALLAKMRGDEIALVEAILTQCIGKLPQDGFFEDIPILVEGFIVTVNGVVMEGVIKLGTIFIK